MPDHLIYQGNRVTESPRVHNRWKPKHPKDIPPESRNVEMFSLTYELSYYHMRPDTSVRFLFSVMEGFINRLWKISNPVSEAFGVFCIVQSLPEENSPYIFKFMKTCKERMFMEHYEVHPIVIIPLLPESGGVTDVIRAEVIEN
ncbi:hypothetical protein Tco_1132750 [Tanacetum coccineum]|uniref:Uncharacterized protein n=1 Tax=Tanacetum coccineum TaxID=301880 RepID=A0ABQ5JDG9_9ASTR